MTDGELRLRNNTKRFIWWTGLLLFFLYLLLLIYFLFFSEGFGRTLETGRRFRYNLVPFLEIRRFWKYRETLGTRSVYINLFGNILGFIPYGMILPVILPKMRQGFLVVLSGLMLSLGVEVLQLVTGAGCFDVDDLLLNSLGAFVGYLIFMVLNTMRKVHYG